MRTTEVMSLAAGTRFGPSHILAKLGKGGWGRSTARAMKLNRDVVIKILPPAVIGASVKYAFGEFVLDLDGRQLLGPSGAIRLSPQAFELLRLLVENRPRALSKRELHEQLWPSTFVLDANLAVLVSDLRAALSDAPRQPRFVRTVHRFGYAFAGDAHPLASPAPPRATSNLCCWMVWENREFPLQAGENIIGRHPQAAVCFNIPGVSRHHARIHIADDVILEDLGRRMARTSPDDA